MFLPLLNFVIYRFTHDTWDTHKFHFLLQDVVILNKVDLVSPDGSGSVIDELEEEIHNINSLANIIRSVRCQVDLSKILNCGAYDASVSHKECLYFTFMCLSIFEFVVTVTKLILTQVIFLLFCSFWMFRKPTIWMLYWKKIILWLPKTFMIVLCGPYAFVSHGLSTWIRYIWAMAICSKLYMCSSLLLGGFEETSSLTANLRPLGGR